MFRRRIGWYQQLETRRLLAVGTIELGPSDNIALDQPRVAIELAADIDPGPGVQWESLGPSLFNTFLLDTGASSVLAMATAIADLEQSRLGYDTQGFLLEGGVAGDQLLDVSVPYRFDFAGSNGIRHTLLDARIMSDATKDFSSFGPWGLVGMPAMEGRVTSLDFSGWSGGGTELDKLYMNTEFRQDVPASNGHRYTLSVDNRISFDPLDQMVSGQPPIWGDVPFLSGIPEHNGIAQEGNFLFDTGAQISLLSKQLALDIGLDSNGDGELDQNDTNFVTNQVVGGVGGQISVPVFGFDEFHLTTDSGEDLVWTDLEWLILDISIPGEETSLDGVFGSDLLTSGWFHAFFSPGQPDGYINQVHMDFREMEIDGTGKVHLDLNPDVDNVILPGPGIIIRQSFRTTDVGEGGDTDTYNIVLTGQPTADVTITLHNADGQVTAINAANGSDSLIFTPDNWETVQTVLVTAVDDVAAEGNHTSTIAHTVSSSDLGYEGRSVADVTVRITDDDLNLLVISSDAGGQNPISSVAATEGGSSVEYWVSLSERPEGETWIVLEDARGQATAVKADNPQLGLENVLMFTSGNWNAPQRVVLQAVNDTLKEGNHVAKMVHTALDVTNFSDPIIGQTPLTVNITDDDLGQVVITPLATQLSEAGTTEAYQIALNRVPSVSVEITVTADTQTMISKDGGVTFASTQILTFADTTPQTITVQAIDDDVAEGTHFGFVAHAISGTVVDTRFPVELSIESAAATIIDNDAAGLTITVDSPASQSAATSESPTTGPLEDLGPSANLTPNGATLEVDEAGPGSLYWVTLDSQPQAEVTVFLRNTDEQVTAVDASEPGRHMLTFNSLNWNTPQQVRIVPSDDPTVEGIHGSQIAHDAFSADANYRGSVLLPVAISDDDIAGITVTNSAVTVSEDGTVFDTFSVALTGQPQTDVVIAVASSDPLEVVADKTSLTFSPADWNTPQTVTVSGLDDATDDGDQDSLITMSVDDVLSDALFGAAVDQTVTATTIDPPYHDYGDAPAPYPTVSSEFGASHLRIGPRLGAHRDGEIDGMPSPEANGDDNDGSTADEDGVQWGGIDVGSTLAALNVSLENAGVAMVDAWIDFDRDGVWSTSEKILDRVVVSSALQTLNYNLPVDVATGITFARVRLSSDGGLSPTGFASDGEVEDYQVNIVSSPRVESVAINHGDAQRSTVDTVTVTFDRIVDLHDLAGDAFHFVNVDTNNTAVDTAVVSQIDDKTVVDFTFVAGPTVSSSGSLVDGDYRLTIDAALVSYFGVGLDGNNDGRGGGDYVFGESPTDQFFRKFGDIDGSTLVDLFDFAVFRSAFGRPANDPGYASGFDSNDDGLIDLFDFAAFRANFGS
jgi:hypothetical protein